MADAHCFNKEQLSSFALGTLEESFVLELAEHIEHCTECNATLCNLDAAVDTVVLQLRQASLTAPFADEAELQRGLLAAQAIGEIPSTPASGQIHPPVDLTESAPQMGEYRFLRKLGEGGMGSVYQAVHTRLGKIVAIKVLPVNQGSNPLAISRFEREMKAIGSLDHPHLIRAFDAGEIDNQHYLVMEYIDGVDLAVLSKSVGQLAVADACEVIRQAALGLEYAHQRSLVHRDIKPSNLMLTTDGQVKVLDMGLALLGQTEDADLALTSSGQIMGTVDYMAPEQGGDTHGVDIRADIYSLGATFYKLLTGQAPHANPKHVTTMQKLTALATQQPVPIQLRRGDIPDALVRIIQQMLAKEPSRRFVSPIEVAKALQPFVAGANLQVLVARGHSGESSAAIIAETQDDVTVLNSNSIPPSTVPGPSHIGDSLRTGNSSNWSKTIRWTVACGASFLMALAGVIFYWPTPHGTVRIEINDPAIKIAFDQQGPEITQADQKVVRLQTGPHKLTVKVGDLEFDTKQFVLKNRTDDVTLKIELLPGKVLVSMDNTELDSHPLPKSTPVTVPAKPTQVAVAAVAKPSDRAKPGQLSRAADLDKPFVLIRDGKQVRDFKTVAGVLAELTAGDEIQVHGNGPFVLPQVYLTDKGFTLRAAPGYRPRFIPSPSAAEQAASPAHSPWLHVQGGAVTLDGCDFDFVGNAGHMAIGSGGPWRITRCRLYQPDANHTQGLIYYTGPKLHISDSVLICGFSYGGIFLTENAELEFQNNFYWSSAFEHFHIPAKGNVKLNFSRNTIDGISIGFGLDPDADVTIHSHNNIFSQRRGASLFRSATKDLDRAKAQIHWNGDYNLYDLGISFNPLGSYAQYYNEMSTKPLIAGKLVDWQKHWGDQERHSFSPDEPTLLYQAAWLPDPADDTLPRLRHWVNRPLEHESPVAEQPPKTDILAQASPNLVKGADNAVPHRDVGPDWNIVGPGQGYLRALAATGHAVPEDQLSPEASEEGTIMLFHEGRAPQGFPNLSAAITAAGDGDVVAIHTGGAVAGDVWTQQKGARQGKRLTLRAGYGYRPTVGALGLAPGDVWSIEGLHFTGDVSVICSKLQADEKVVSSLRLANCSFAPGADWQLNQGPSLCLLEGADDGPTCEVINSVLPNYLTFATRRLKIVNSAICGFVDGGFKTKVAREFDLERCAIYCDDNHMIYAGKVPLSVTATRCWFEFGYLLLGGNAEFQWQGDHNVYCHGPSRWINAEQIPDLIFNLNTWQARWKSDAHSTSGAAAYVDPHFYSLLPGSPGLKASEDGKDLGADLTRFAESTR